MWIRLKLLKLGFDRKAVQERIAGVFPNEFYRRVKRAGSILYAVLIFVAAGIGIWLSIVLSSTTTFSQVRPALQASLGSLGVFFGAGNTNANLVATLVVPGQIAALDELPLVSPVSTKVLSIHVKEGQEIVAGTLIARLDDGAAVSALRGAETELALAERDLAQRSTRSFPLPAPSAPDTTSARAAVIASYERSFTDVADTMVHMSWIIDGNHEVLYGDEVSPSRTQQNVHAYSDMVKQSFPDVSRYRAAAENNYQAAHLAYTKNRASYAAASRTSAPQTIEDLTNETYAMLQASAQSLKSTNEFLVFVQEGLQNQNRAVPELLTEAQIGVAERIQTVNDNLESLRNALSALREARDFLTEKEREGMIAPAAGEEVIDEETLQIRVTIAQRDLVLAKVQLEKYVVYAPASGKISGAPIRAGKFVVYGEVLVTVVSPENVAKVVLKESEVGNVHVGQKAVVSFDAIEGFSVEGKVLKVDLKASVADDIVVFYALIGFTGDSSKAREGMTVTARIEIP